MSEEPQVSIRAVDPVDERCVWAMAQYFDELDHRMSAGFDPETDGATDPAELRPPRGAFLLATSGDATVGCAAVTFLSDTVAEIRRMWVAPQERGSGLGRRLLAAAENAGVESGRSTARLDTHEALTQAISLYESVGYRPIADYNNNPNATHWFERPLP